MLSPAAYNLDHKDGGSMFILNAGNHVKQYMVS